MATTQAAAPYTVTVTVKLTEDEAEAMAQMCKRFGWDHANSLANAYDGGYERGQMLRAVAGLRLALDVAGFSPR